MADSVVQSYPIEQWSWHYEHGLVVKAIYETGDAFDIPRLVAFAHAWVDHFVTPTGHIRSYRQADFNLDQINPGKLLFPFYRKTGEDRYARALEFLYVQLQRQPRTENGAFWHKKIYPHQVWLDGLFMAAPFMVEYGQTFQAPQIFEDVIRQLMQIEEHARDPQTGLLYHAWDAKRAQRWADPQTGCSPHFWGRALGWYAMALVDVLALLAADQNGRAELVAILQRLASALLRYQDTATGLWYQVVDLAGRPGNYLESSVSAMLAYALARAVRLDCLPADYLLVAQRAYRGLLENKIKMDAGGNLILDGTCSVAGLGGRPYRDGSYAYYIGEKTAANDFKGVGPFILASLELEAAGGEEGG
ncbi:MAG: glycoside hydrolase family 88 protein [Anaerolineales bacterium]|nr:glycoside hydrolase family 88 protein [Anaerolineales bacterium]